MGESRTRRPRHEGGLYQKTAYTTDAQGIRHPYTYWQAVRDIPASELPPGLARKRITGNGKTPQEARERLAQNFTAFLLRPDALQRSLPRPRRKPQRGQLSLSEFHALWHAQLAYTDVSDTVRRKYERDFLNHIGPTLGQKRLNQVEDSDINLLLGDVLLKPHLGTPKKAGGKPPELGPLGASARRNVYSLLNVMFGWAVSKGYIIASPMRGVKSPKVPKKSRDVEALAAQALELVASVHRDRHPDYCRMLLQFLGLRRAERLGITWANVRNLDSDEPLLVVNQQLARYETSTDPDDPKGWYIKRNTKTYNDRTIVIPEPFRTALAEHKARQDAMRTLASWAPDPAFADLVFLQDDGSLITLNRDNDDWHAILDKYGMPYWMAHVNRHITATLLAEQDPPVPEGTVRNILGHESEAMGIYYQHVTKRQQAVPMKRYGQTNFAALMPQATN